MSFEIRDLMVKLSSGDDPEGDYGDYGQGLPCDPCQTTSKEPGCPPPSLCPCLSFPESQAPGEEDVPLAPPPEESEGPCEKAAGLLPEVGLALLQRQLRQTLSQTV